MTAHRVSNSAIIITLIIIALMVWNSWSFLVPPAEAHGTPYPNHKHVDSEGFAWYCIGTPTLEDNPLGHYNTIAEYPHYAYVYNGQYHEHQKYWDNKGHLVGGSRIRTYNVCGWGM